MCECGLMQMLYLDIALVLDHIQTHAHTHTHTILPLSKSCLVPGSKDGRPYPDNGASKLDLIGANQMNTNIIESLPSHTKTLSSLLVPKHHHRHAHMHTQTHKPPNRSYKTHNLQTCMHTYIHTHTHAHTHIQRDGNLLTFPC